MTEPTQSTQDAAALTAEEQAELAQFDYDPDEEGDDYEEDEGDEETNPHDRKVAVAPLLEIDPDDVKEGASAFDAWLRSISGDSLNVERLRMLAGSLPAVGNIMAVVDVFGDIVTLVENKTNDPLDWVNLGINLLGAIPAPGTAAARMTLRPMVMMIKQEFKRQLKQNLKAELSDVVITRLAAHLNDSTEGQLGKFAEEMRAALPDMLRQAANWGEELVIYIGHALQDAAKAKLNAQGEIENARKEWDQAVDPLLNDPDKQITHMLSAFWSLCKATVKHIVNTISEYMVPPAVRAKVLGVAQAVLDMAPVVREQIKNLGDESKTLSVGWLLMKFSQATTCQGGIAVAGNLRQGSRGRVKYKHKGPTHGSLSKQRKAKKNAKRCKTGTGGTCGSISFALGTETITHTDFTLPGPFALEWARTYCSNLAGYDQGILGARWISDYTTLLDLRSEGPDQEGVRYYGADGRSHNYPLPNVGGLHYDPIEGIMLVRTGPQTLTLAAGHERREIYQQHRRHFRLTAIELRNGARLALHYEHQLCARSVLSDLISYQGDTLHTHIGTQLDETGRIIGLWQIADGQRKRQLAQYQYDESGDLIQAHDEHAGQWDYRYQHHLLNRYTDRTGRGMNLLWKGTSRHAKAVREWADDGSFDVSLKWDKNIRLTTLTDAHGNQTEYYYDILGYPYRIVHPDGLSEWLDRDAARNVTQHLHTDASVHSFAYDERSNLLEHERPDNSTVHYAYDGQDQLIKIRDPEGGLWTRDYDQRGNLIEATDPLGNKTQYSYDSAGQLTGITDAKGGQSTLAYDANGQLTQYTDCSGQRSSWKYDALGQQIESCDAQGNVTRYAYHAGHLITVIHPDGAEEHFERDAEGRLLTHTDALKRRTRWSYTVAGMIAQRTDAMGHSVDYQWDKLGQLTGLVNENERSMRFAYDPAGRLLEETGVDGKTTHYHYHSRNGILAEIRHGRLQTAFTFDPLGRVTERRARKLSASGSIASAPGPWQVETYAYDGNGRLALAGNSGSRLQWFYDAAGNLVREHQHYLAPNAGQVAVWRHEYDALNQRIATIRPDGQREDRLTYGSGHVHGILLN